MVLQQLGCPAARLWRCIGSRMQSAPQAEPVRLLCILFVQRRPP